MTHSLIVFNQRLKVFWEMAILQLFFCTQNYYIFLGLCKYNSNFHLHATFLFEIYCKLALNFE